MPRPKTRSDEEVLDAALVLLRHGRLTFASVAAACGLSAATLVQRFSTKDGLRQQALLRAWDLLDARTRELAATTARTPQGAIELLLGLSGQYDDINQYAENLLILREDLRDPVLRKRGAAWKVDLALALDERFPDAPEDTGYLLAAHWQGAVTWWAFTQDGPLDLHLRESLERLVALIASEHGA